MKKNENLASNLSEEENPRLAYPDFDESIQRHGFSLSKYNEFYADRNFQSHPIYASVKNSLKNLYDRDRRKPFVPSNVYSIPPVIHQIWLGSPVPERYLYLMKAWKNLTGWTYCLWTDTEAEKFSLVNEDLYRAARNYGERSDILRYEILQRYGGVYIDIDVECLNPESFDFFHKTYRFYAGLEPLDWGKPLILGNAIVASSPGHPLLETLVQNLKQNWKTCQTTANPLPQDEDPYKSFETFIKTGPLYFTQKITENLNLLGTDGIVFPPTFFYPIIPREFPHRDLYIFPETCALHYWAHHWMSDEGTVRTCLRTRNETSFDERYENAPI